MNAKKIVALLFFVFLGLGAVVLLANFSTKPTPSSPAGPEVTASPSAAGPVQIKFKDYHSEQYGYRLSLPEAWTVTEEASGGALRVLVRQPQGAALVGIDARQYASLAQPGEIEKAIAQRKKELEEDATLQLTGFQSAKEGTVGGYLARGTQTIQGVALEFEERGLLAENGRFLIFHSAYLSQLTKDLGQANARIIDSFTLE